MAATVGEFLVQKIRNMAQWMEQERVGGAAGLVEMSSNITPLSATLLATGVKTQSDAVSERDWAHLGTQFASEATKHALFAPFVAVFEGVRARADLHERFWRYMDLMCEVA
jgi:hypothetical protein